MLKTLVPGQLWIAEMPAERAGFEFGARMTVVRLPNGQLWIHSPIELTPELKGGLDAIGPVGYLISPSGLHHMHVPEFAEAYPQAKIYAAPGSAPKLAAVKVEGVLGDTPPAEWAADLDQILFRGSRLFDEADFYHPSTRTLILTDLCFNIPTNRSLTTRIIARMLGVLGRLSMSRLFPLTLKDRGAARASLERILAWDFDRILLTHGDIVETGGKSAFRAIFSRYLM